MHTVKCQWGIVLKSVLKNMVFLVKTKMVLLLDLTKEQVLRTKEQNPVPHLASNEYKRLVGGKLINRGMGSLKKMIPRLLDMKQMSGAGMSAGGASAGGLSGGGISAGKKSVSKMAKHFSDC